MRCAALEEEAHGDSEERQRGAARERELLAQIQQLEEESLETQEATAAALHEYQRNLMLLRDARAANARLERLVSRYKGKKKDLESKIKGMEKKLAAYKAYQWGDGSDLMPRLPGIEPPDVRYGGSRSPGKSVQKSEAMPQGCAKHTSVQDGALLQADATPGCSARGGGPSSEWQDMHGGAIHTTDSGVLPPGASKDPPGLERKPGSRSMASKCCPLLARGEDRACQQRMHAGATGSPDVWAEASAAAANAAISIVQPHELGKHEEPRAPSTAMENGKKRVQVRECECPSVAKAQGPLLPGSGEECQSKGEVEEDVGFVPDSLPMEEAGGDLFEGQPLEPYLSRCRRIGSARPRHSVGTKAVQLTPETAAPEDSEATEPPWESPGSSVGPIAKSPSQPLEMDGLPASQAREVNSINAERQEELTGRGVESKTKAPVGGEQGAPSGLHDSARNLRGCSNIAPPLHRAGQSAALPWHITADADSVARICYEGSVAVWQSDPQGDEAEEVAGAFETQSSAASAPQSARRESVGNPPGTLRVRLHPLSFVSVLPMSRMLDGAPRLPSKSQPEIGPAAEPRLSPLPRPLAANKRR